VKPISGLWLAHLNGWSLTEPWLLLSIGLYVLTGLCWLPVVWLQYQLRNLAHAAAQSGQPLPPKYHALFRLWFALGIPAFCAVMAILWLMIARPNL
jgi:uncharacterized membrane protein